MEQAPRDRDNASPVLQALRKRHTDVCLKQRGELSAKHQVNKLLNLDLLLSLIFFLHLEIHIEKLIELLWFRKRSDIPAGPSRCEVQEFKDVREDVKRCSNDFKIFQDISSVCFFSSHLLLPLLLLFPLLLSLKSSPQLRIRLESKNLDSSRHGEHGISQTIKIYQDSYKPFIDWFWFIHWLIHWFIHWFIHWLIHWLIHVRCHDVHMQQVQLWAGLSLSFVCFSTSLALRQATSSDSRSIKQSDSWTTREIMIVTNLHGLGTSKQEVPINQHTRIP